MEERIRDKDIDLRVEVRPARVVKVHTDREKLGRILLHLLDNAVKFSPLGGVVAVSIHKDINGFSLHVLDAGEGVDEGEAANIFEPFYQLDGSVTRTHGGMGLGLAIVQRLAGALGGSVSVESPPRSLTPLGPGRGSLLSVRLPASVSPVPE
jgi:signal transduction histidine kinase